MAVTNVHYVKRVKKVRRFKIEGKTYDLKVDSFENGIAYILPIYMISINELAEIISDLFNESSNFKSELFKAFNCNSDTEFIGIQFEFNFVNFLITKENADANKICEMYSLGLDEFEKKYTKNGKHIQNHLSLKQ